MDKQTINFRDICKQESLKIITKPAKKITPSILKLLSKISFTEAELLLVTYPDIISKEYSYKSALHWATLNKNPHVLELVFKTFKQNNIDIFVRCSITKNNKFKENIASYALSLKKYDHFIVASAHGLEIPNMVLYADNNSFLLQHLKTFSQEDKNSFNKLITEKPLTWKNSPLNIAFWHQHPSLLKLIFEYDFLEKNEWINQLKEEIDYFMQLRSIRTTIYDSIIYYLMPHISFPETLKILQLGLDFNSNNKKDEYLYIANSLNLYWNTYFYIENIYSVCSEKQEQFNKDILRYCFTKEIDGWHKFCNNLTKYSIDITKYEHLHSISKLILSYELHQELHINNTKKKTSKI